MQLTLESTPRTKKGRAAARFASVALDVDRGISNIDGIRWLAERRGDLVSRRVAALAVQVRDGTMSFARAYGEGLRAIRPRRDDLEALAQAYLAEMRPGAADAVARCRRAGIHVAMVSHAPRNAMFGVAAALGIDPQHVAGVEVHLDPLGAYWGFDERSTLATTAGKHGTLASMGMSRPVLIVGGGRDEEPFASLEAFVAPDQA